MSRSPKAIVPQGSLYRLGRLPDPLAWPPREYAGDGRFDDPLGEFGVLYAAEQRLACLVETLYRFRRPLVTLETERALRADEAPPSLAATLPSGWVRTRGFCSLQLDAERQWLDLRSVDTRESLRPTFASLLEQLRLPEFDLGAVYGSHRVLTQTIARWAYERGFAGLRYGSRYVEEFNCWAVFEHPGRATFHRIGEVEPIPLTDPDLQAAMDLFELTAR